MKKYAVLAGVVSLVAVAFSNVFASFLWTYQPEAPKCLNK